MSALSFAAVVVVCVTAVILWGMTLYRQHLESETGKRVAAVERLVAEIDARTTFAVAEVKAAENRLYEHERKLMAAMQAGRGMPVRV
jgi:hypothetical protein